MTALSSRLFKGFQELAGQLRFVTTGVIHFHSKKVFSLPRSVFRPDDSLPLIRVSDKGNHLAALLSFLVAFSRNRDFATQLGVFNEELSIIRRIDDFKAPIFAERLNNPFA